jgi:hypothetical protein
MVNLVRFGHWHPQLRNLAGLFLALFLAISVSARAADPVEADAQAYTQLVLRHDALLFKDEMGRATNAEREEMARLRAEGALIQKKYASGGGRAAEYQKRVKELSLTVVAAARREWVTAALPEAEMIVAGFGSDAERYAALRTLLSLLEFRGDPASAAGSAKRQGYRQAMDRISPPASFDAKLFSERLRLEESRQFRYDVIHRFIPPLDADAERKLKEEQYANLVVESRRIFWGSVAGLVGVTLGIPVLFVMFGQRPWWRRGPLNPDPTFQLPRELSRIRVLWQAYDVNFDCGKITDRQQYTATYTWTTRTPGRRYEIGDTVYQEETVTHHKREQERVVYTLTTTDGRTLQRDYPVWELEATAGDIVSVIEHGDRTLMSCNHSTGKEFSHFSGMADVHGFRGGVLWLFAFAICLAGMFAIDKLLVPRLTLDNPMLRTVLGAWALLAGLVAAIEIAIIKSMVVKARDRHFDAKWEPKLRAFMAAKTSTLRQHYAESPGR